MSELPLSQELAIELNKQWRESMCKDDTLTVMGVKVEQKGTAVIVEVEHWHYSEPHVRYWRQIKRDDQTIEECSPQPALSH